MQSGFGLMSIRHLLCWKFSALLPGFSDPFLPRNFSFAAQSNGQSCGAKKRDKSTRECFMFLLRAADKISVMVLATFSWLHSLGLA